LKQETVASPPTPMSPPVQAAPVAPTTLTKTEEKPSGPS